MRTRTVPDAKLIQDVGIDRSQIGNGVVAKHESLEHGFVDDSPGDFLIGSDRFQPGIADRWADDFAIDAVKIDLSAILISLGAERHQNKTEWFHKFSFRNGDCRTRRFLAASK